VSVERRDSKFKISQKTKDKSHKTKVKTRIEEFDYLKKSFA